MTEEKRKRMAAAITVSVILLIVILTAIVIYQFVVLSATQKHKRNIENEISYLQEQTANEKQTLEDLQSDWYLQQKLVEQGYHY